MVLAFERWPTSPMSLLQLLKASHCFDFWAWILEHNHLYVKENVFLNFFILFFDNGVGAEESEDDFQLTSRQFVMFFSAMTLKMRTVWLNLVVETSSGVVTLRTATDSHQTTKEDFAIWLKVTGLNLTGLRSTGLVGDASLSVTRIHPVVMLQADRRFLLLGVHVTPARLLL